MDPTALADGAGFEGEVGRSPARSTSSSATESALRPEATPIIILSPRFSPSPEPPALQLQDVVQRLDLLSDFLEARRNRVEFYGSALAIPLASRDLDDYAEVQQWTDSQLEDELARLSRSVRDYAPEDLEAARNLNSAMEGGGGQITEEQRREFDATLQETRRAQQEARETEERLEQERAQAEVEEEADQQALFVTSLRAGQSSRSRRRRRLPLSFEAQDQQAEEDALAFDEFLQDELDRQEASAPSRPSWTFPAPLDLPRRRSFEPAMADEGEEELWAAGWGPPLPFGEEQQRTGQRLWRNTPLDVPRPFGRPSNTSERRTIVLPSRSLHAALLPTPPTPHEESIEETEWRRRRAARSPYTGLLLPPLAPLPGTDTAAYAEQERLHDQRQRERLMERAGAIQVSRDDAVERQAARTRANEARRAALLARLGGPGESEEDNSWEQRLDDLAASTQGNAARWEAALAPPAEPRDPLFDLLSPMPAPNAPTFASRLPPGVSPRLGELLPGITRTLPRPPPPLARLGSDSTRYDSNNSRTYTTNDLPARRPRQPPTASTTAVTRSAETTQTLMGRTLRMKRPVVLLYCGASPRLSVAAPGGVDPLPAGFAWSSKAGVDPPNIHGCGALVSARGLVPEQSMQKVFDSSLGRGNELEDAISSDLPPPTERVRDLKPGQKEKVEIRAEGCLGCKVKEIGCCGCGNLLGFRVLRPCLPCSSSSTARSSNRASSRSTGALSLDGFHWHFRRSAVTPLHRIVKARPEPTLTEELSMREHRMLKDPQWGAADEGKGRTTREGRIEETDPRRGAMMTWRKVPSPQADFDAGLVSEPMAWLLPSALKSETWWIEHGVLKHCLPATTPTSNMGAAAADHDDSDSDLDRDTQARLRAARLRQRAEVSSSSDDSDDDSTVIHASRGALSVAGPFSRSVAQPPSSSPSGVTLSRSHAMRVSVAGSLRRSGGVRARVDTLGEGEESGRRVRARRESGGESGRGRPRDPNGMDELMAVDETVPGYGSAFREERAVELDFGWGREVAGR